MSRSEPSDELMAAGRARHKADAERVEARIRRFCRVHGRATIAINVTGAACAWRVHPDMLREAMIERGWVINGDMLTAPGMLEGEDAFTCTRCGVVVASSFGMDDDVCDLCAAWADLVSEWT